MVSRVEKVGAQPLVEAGAGMPKSPTDGLILSNGLASKPSNTARYGVQAGSSSKVPKIVADSSEPSDLITFISQVNDRSDSSIMNAAIVLRHVRC